MRIDPLGRDAVNHQSYAPMVEVTRGGFVESSHRGVIAVVEASGRLVASLGSPAQPIIVRSCAKPFQALALVCSGAADAFGLTEEELAVVCASHSGEEQHVRAVASLLKKAGVDPNALLCGPHPPFDGPARRALAASGQEPTALHNNCSGKHAGMLVTARHLGLPLEQYTAPDHGVQAAILGLLGYLSGLEPSEIDLAVDGCTAPTFHLPLRSFALAMARLAAAGENLPVARSATGFEDEEEDRDNDWRVEAGTIAAYGEDEDTFPVPVRAGLARVWHAMKSHPVLIAGSRGRLCTDLMNVARSVDVDLVAKSGAEGCYAMAVVQDDRAYGIALKVEDGAQRARDAAAIETLLQLDLLPESTSGSLAAYHQQVVLNRRDELVGDVRAHFRLHHGLPK